MTEKHMSLMDHLAELRKVILISLVSLIPATAVGWFLTDWAMEVLTKPLRDINPDMKLLALGLISPFFTFFKMAMGIGVVLALPVILYQIWSFLLPALKQNERKALIVIVPVSVLLFVVGVIFGYLTVFQIAIKFLWQFAVDTGTVMPAYALQEYLSFAVGFHLGFGFVFELPIIILTLARFGIVSPRFLAEKRKYALLIIVIIAAFLTPGPDVVSQILMAAPMYILYEISIWLSYLVRPKAVTENESDEEDQEEEEREMEVREIEEFLPHSVEELEEYNRRKGLDSGTESNLGDTDKEFDDGDKRLAKILDDIEEAGKPEDNKQT
ncbi:MAG: twin-arginine translocase subunit TatC [Clostridia bacterium]|nr:twin-arginine translocase subunit TatC [Clostridia bacterium]